MIPLAYQQAKNDSLMTVAIVIQVNDGLVLASDSAMTLSDLTKTGPESVLNVYNNANKIYNLRKGLPIGGMAYGAGSIGASSISTLAKDVRLRFSGLSQAHQDWHLDAANYTVEQVAIRVREFLFDECYAQVKTASPNLTMGFVVAGYSSGAQLSEVWLVSIENGNSPPPKQVMAQGLCSWYAGGDPEIVCRIGNGFSPKAPAILQKLGIDQAQITAIVDAFSAELPEPIIAAPMPIQDTIDLAEFFVLATANVSRFRHGAAMVGGPTESAAITKHEGFKWTKRKHYFPMALNPGDDL